MNRRGKPDRLSLTADESARPVSAQSRGSSNEMSCCNGRSPARRWVPDITRNPCTNLFRTLRWTFDYCVSTLWDYRSSRHSPIEVGMNDAMVCNSPLSPDNVRILRRAFRNEVTKSGWTEIRRPGGRDSCLEFTMGGLHSQNDLHPGSHLTALSR